MSKKMQWALVVAIATAGVGAGSAYAASNGKDAFGLGKSGFFVPQQAASGDVQKRGLHKTENTELLSLLKLDQQALKDKRQAGQSLAEIAQAQGVTRQQLIDFLKSQEETELAQAVKDGKVAQDQADKMKVSISQKVENMIDAKGDADLGKHGEHGEYGFGFHKIDSTELLNILKLDEQGLKDKRKAGQSLAEIATAQGVTRQQLIDLLTKQNEDQLAQAAKDGKIPQAKLDEMKTAFPQMVEKMIDAKGEGDFEHGGPGKMEFGPHLMDNADLLTLLKLDQKTLHEKHKAGQTLEAIAEAQGVTRQQLIDFLTKQQADQLAQAVKDGKLTQDKADKMTASFPQMVNKIIDAKPADEQGKFHGKDRGAAKQQTPKTNADTNTQSNA